MAKWNGLLTFEGFLPAAPSTAMAVQVQWAFAQVMAGCPALPDRRLLGSCLSGEAPCRGRGAAASSFLSPFPLSPEEKVAGFLLRGCHCILPVGGRWRY